MKKLLGIIILGLLLSGNAYANLILDNCQGRSSDDGLSLNFNLSIDDNEDFISLVGSRGDFPLKGVFKISKSSSQKIITNNISYANLINVSSLGNSSFRKKVDLALINTNIYLEIFPSNGSVEFKMKTIDSGDKKIINAFKATFASKSVNSTTSIKCNKTNKTLTNTSKIEMASMINKAKDTCKSLGFKEGTEKFADCSLKLYSQSVELAAEQNKQVVMQPQSSGSNVITIYDPVRDSNALMNKGMKMLSGKCTLGIDC